MAEFETDAKRYQLESAKRAETAAKKQRATEAAGVVLVRRSVAKMPDEAMIPGLT